MEGKIPEPKSKSVGSQTDNEDLEHGHSELARQSDDGSGQLTLVASRPEHPGPINMLSGSTAIFGNVGCISMSSPQVESDVRALQESNAETKSAVTDLMQDQSVLTTNVEKLQVGHEKLEQNVSELARKVVGNQVLKVLEPITQEAIDEIKKKYRQQYKMHEIHYVDNNDRTELKEVDINKFAVKLKITRELPTMDTFRDEVRQHFAHVQGMRGDDIEISRLTDDKNRVTFIRGIAGMGKSVLAKQLTYGWANGDIYQNFRICVMFECRDLNYFKDRRGVELKKHEILHDFLKSKINYDLGDGEGVLVIVDGLDELYDITEKDSIIFDLLNINGNYGMAKVIITGRPHVEDKLIGYNNMGGLFKVEINGLSEDQIDEYVDKFSSREDHKVDINKARTSSRGYLPIMNVPQFLNTLCCVAILMKGQAVFNNTELYCWTVYLLLKQHADKQKGQDLSTISQVFTKYSNTLAYLSELCYNLLKENKIIFQGNIESTLGETDEEKAFIKSLFVDVKDNYTDKYQFKHLSLMEFLSALYICKNDMKTLLEIIKDNLEKGFIEVVSFVCRLLSEFSQGGIIKEMLKNVVGLKQEVNEKQLLDDVIELLNMCRLDWKTKFSRSFEIITFFLNKNFNDKEFIKSIISKCHGVGLVSDEVTTHNMCLICRHLESCGWKEDDIRMAFANVQFELIVVHEMEQLDMVTVNERFHIAGFGIWLHGMTTTVNAIRKRFKGGEHDGYCGEVVMEGCELMDDKVNGGYSNDRQLKRLRIVKCHMKTKESFLNTCDWGMSCEGFVLKFLDIKIEWWGRMVEMMEERRRKGDLKTKTLYIYICTTRMNADMKSRIVQCGVELEIDRRDATGPLQSESDLTTKEEEDLQLAIALSLSIDVIDRQKKPHSPSTSPSTVDLPPLTESPSSSEEPDHRLRTLPPSTTGPLQSESDLTTKEEEDLQLAIALSLSIDEIDRQDSPSSSEESYHRLRALPPSTMSTSIRMTSTQVDVHSTVDHSTPPHSPSSGTPSHDVRTPSQYPALPTSTSSPSAGRPTVQVPTDLTHTSTTLPSSTVQLTPGQPTYNTPYNSCTQYTDHRYEMRSSIFARSPLLRTVHPSAIDHQWVSSASSLDISHSDLLDEDDLD